MEIPDLKGHAYRTGRLNAFAQFHVSRRLAPMFAVMGAHFMALMRAPVGDEVADMGRFVEIAQPVAEMLAKMTDEDSNYVLHTCLGVCARRITEGKYQQVIAQGQFMFEDIDMDTMLRLVIAVMQENLQGFLPGQSESTRSPSP